MATGILLRNGCRIVHGAGANIKRPFADIPSLVMHELDGGVSSVPGPSLSKITPSGLSPSGPANSTFEPTPVAFHGQLGFIPFTTSVRLPRHVHISDSVSEIGRRLVTERILVLSGVALVELNGLVYVIPSGSLVTIAPGVPHTWTACPANVKMPDAQLSRGEFLMVYEYEAPTGFFPTDAVETLNGCEEYKEFRGNLDDIRFPELSATDIVRDCKLAWGKDLLTLRDEV